MVNTRSSSRKRKTINNEQNDTGVDDTNAQDSDEKGERTNCTTIETKDNDDYYRYVTSLGREAIIKRIEEGEKLKEHIGYMMNPRAVWDQNPSQYRLEIPLEKHPYKHLKLLMEARLEYVNLMLELMELEEKDDDVADADDSDDHENDEEKENHDSGKQNSNDSRTIVHYSNTKIQVSEIDSTNNQA
ncbi:uncharacterized protein LOC113789835 [Dermatophagoides pteronyssinus]|uniref:Uncharacterized protein n=2 Tax=Dermatophagoides pteronyssinus TaxID=6956 RepID=A0ABQ8JT63_DERPT|nr:uncharacterized protein LOC113789835 [Dermatophagoides pteronyssinus]KAH9425774.1 hypothetical protein DERP_004992 [Dermatophagoides pteronyssinus]